MESTEFMLLILLTSAMFGELFMRKEGTNDIMIVVLREIKEVEVFL